MSPKRHHIPLSGGDRKALSKELRASPGIERMLAIKSADLRGRGEAMLREADSLECQSWNERMWREGGPIDPSPSVDQAINGGFSWLEIECSRCRAQRDVDLTAVKHVATTCVHDLASRLSCQRCKRGSRGAPATLKQLAQRSRGAARD